MILLRMNVLAVTVLAVGAVAADEVSSEAGGIHTSENHVLRQLLIDGIRTADGQTFQLPAPMMSDDLSPQQQQDLIKQNLGGRPIDRYLRNSVVAPHICQLTDAVKTEAFTIRQVDFWFIGYADLEQLTSSQFVIFNEADETTTLEIKNKALTARGLPRTTDAGGNILSETFGHLRYNLLNKIQLAATGRAFVTRGESSIVAAGIVDPRFRDDAEYPNQWRRLSPDDAGKLVAGATQPYDGGGGYLKATRLSEPRGALFIEGHLLLVEPIGWFGGKNQLRAKMPAIIQSQVRSVRRALLKTSRQ